MMTEDEAKQRWCPLVRFKSMDTGSGPAFNRMVDPQPLETLCIGSKCMAWRERAQERNNIEVQGYCGAFGGQS